MYIHSRALLRCGAVTQSFHVLITHKIHKKSGERGKVLSIWPVRLDMDVILPSASCPRPLHCISRPKHCPNTAKALTKVTGGKNPCHTQFSRLNRCRNPDKNWPQKLPPLAKTTPKNPGLNRVKPHYICGKDVFQKRYGRWGESTW